MNWIEIRKKYPKSYAKWYCFTQIDTAEKSLQTNNIIYYTGLLFYFFDDNGIVINITNDYSEDETKFKYWYIISQLIEQRIQNEYFHSRKEAESEAFEKAFEILESKLK